VARILRQNVPSLRSVPATAAETWTCPTCRRTIDTTYCPSCGERPRSPRDLTLRGLLDQAFEAITSIDGKLLRSFRDLVARPGALTVAFVEGRRKPYIGPIALFLVINVVFFAVESLTHGLVFSTTLQSHMTNQPWSVPAAALISKRLAAAGTTVAAYEAQFDTAIAVHAHSMILLMVLVFVPLPALVLWRHRRPFAVHAVFSLHLYGFMLLLLSLGNFIPAAGLPFGYERSPSVVLDAILSIALMVACAVYLYVSIGRVYGGGRWSRLAEAIALASGVGAIVLGYRYLLLIITLYTTT
jgi:Protein of unknown function (DUF3667)